MKKALTSGETCVFDFKHDAVLVLLADQNHPTPKIKNFILIPPDELLFGQNQQAISKRLSEFVDLKSPPPAAIVWESGMTFRQLVLPDLPAQDLERAFLSEMRNKYSFSQEESLFAKDCVGEYENEEGGKEKVYSVFYCNKKMAMEKITAVQQLGFTVVNFLPAQAALAQWIGTKESSREEDVLLFDIGFQTARLLMVRKNKIMLSRTVPLGGHSLTEMLTSPLHSLEEAEKLKMSEGVSDPQAAHIGLARPYLEKIVAEIKRSVDFYESQEYSRQITKVVFTGGGANLKGLGNFMAQFLGMETVVPKGEDGSFFSALGASAAETGYFNLLPDEVLHQRRESTKRMSLRMVFTMSLIVLVFFIGWVSIRTMMAQSQLKVMEAEWKEASRMNELLLEMVNQQRFRIDAVQGDIAHAGLWKNLSRIVPASVLLEEMEFNRAEGTLILRGVVGGDQNQEVKVIAQFMNDLLSTPFFKDAALTNSVQDASGLKSRFEIKCLTKGIL